MNKSSSRTLLFSVIMSAPGPLVVGIGLFLGKSSTQIADFFRRTIELLAIIVSFIVFKITNKNNCPSEKKFRLEKGTSLFVGITMCVAGLIMLFLTIFANSNEKGNVIPGLCISLLGVIANSFFWIKYSFLNKREPNLILETQARLYRAKSLVDICVTIALLALIIAPNSNISYYLDYVSSIIVSLYMVYCGLKIVWQKIKRSNLNG